MGATIKGTRGLKSDVNAAMGKRGHGGKNQAGGPTSKGGSGKHSGHLSNVDKAIGRK